ncbi:hypothetical protein A2833_03280 [Candidatus Azambacteria bacterium RIFCSPHIGHO2_01_FULL_44_55]|nr:MAG: hypothetical protein A3A18_03195 [Candidatus Azambacteria bacterium RIFCSPLOWO2_01_FULL_44_84]OGD33618.1 MAG: hypothetical protein A3C78_00430 [Candidatus Azambacteria bacterium RIFCSPHIGHO2_02_FULL_45_18]OGD40794.1 MAG: hypothetical protein A2833_03280 [Candidatus Azambacteria bacterium RIFCSPHIGHO2_01_FULL_44_55]OGD49713.1 MAG: hypothetical protein A2608_01280 [Candidatus Azambacteria bacterium RIFOXYD1_FULL_44_10]
MSFGGRNPKNWRGGGAGCRLSNAMAGTAAEKVLQPPPPRLPIKFFKSKVRIFRDLKILAGK